MTGRLALEIEAAERRIAALECSLRVYAGHPAAYARVAAQLDDAWAHLRELEEER